MTTSVFIADSLDKGLVRRSFEQAAGHYNQFTGLQREIGDCLMQRHILDQSFVGNVLDIGAGTGYLTQQLVRAFPAARVHALDISLGMLQQTRGYVMADEKLELVCADVDQLSFIGNSMDVVCSNLALQWCSDLSTTYAQVFDVLKPKGEFVFATFGPNTLQELKRAWQSADDAVHVNSFVAENEIVGYLNAAGFDDISVSSEDLLMYYESPKQLMLDLKGMGAHNINKGRQPGLTGVTAYKKMLNTYEALRTNKGIPATFQAIYASATKSSVNK
ncbi:MAG: malonyl-[acyl-carrier protein] O-methyltransferase BioC [Piscirickettsiaceae bacterium]|nr:MAG: malonyl-[acyl-carrier protein] O-methyltransferase BioC [Piscirickettsiaceae bacterium]